MSELLLVFAEDCEFVKVKRQRTTIIQYFVVTLGAVQQWFRSRYVCVRVCVRVACC